MKFVSLIQKVLMKLFGLDILARQSKELCDMTAYLALQEILQDGKYSDKKRISKCGFKVHSQADEDGIIHEIFRRIGAKHKVFVEIGVSHGLECNTLYLLRQGWRGVWVDGDPDYGDQVRKLFADKISSGELVFLCKFVDRNNIHVIFEGLPENENVDLLSIDIDGNDYHLLQDILPSSRPRVIVLEYNPIFAPPIEWIMKYNPNHRWDITDHYSASLKSYELMLSKHGYSLVGCGMNGNNAFFVRTDIAGDHFCADTSAEFHYEPQRFWLTSAFRGGYPMRRNSISQNV